MKVIIDGREFVCDNVMISSKSVTVGYEPGPTRVPPKSELIQGYESVQVWRQNVDC